MVRPEGLEPPAYRFEACRSIQLSYGRAMNKNLPQTRILTHDAVGLAAPIFMKPGSSQRLPNTHVFP